MHRFVVTDARTGARVQQASLRLNGQPTPTDTALRIGKEQMLQVTAQGYLFYDTLFNTGADTRERTIAVRMIPLEKDLVLQLRNIQFEYDSYELTESSNEQLEAVAQLLFMNPSLHIELSAHTDDQGSDKYNDRLSLLRGQAVEAWLRARGVDAGRMTAAGYGKRKPLVANDSEEHRALNRRVEIKVTEF
jgi:outer membrane protein OmpA-like peptidoglycan-associated protein